jgi:hypothetical protein
MEGVSYLGAHDREVLRGLGGNKGRLEKGKLVPLEAMGSLVDLC